MTLPSLYPDRRLGRRFHMGLALAGCLLAVSAWAAPPSTLSPADQQAIDAIVGDGMKTMPVPSVSGARVIDGHLAYSRAYGQDRLQPPRAATPDTRYEIGSNSKQFLAATLLMLEAEGRLHLDDQVGQYIPDLGPAGEVTLRQLLSHTGGVRDYYPQDYVFPDMLKATTPQEIAARWARRPLDFSPGTRWQYSNTGYTLAGMVVEKVTGQPLFAVMQERILTPLGMTHTVDADQHPPAPEDALGYTTDGLGGPLRPAVREAPGWLFGAGELAMTAEDLARWDTALIDQRLLTPAGYRSFFTETLLANGAGTQYGLGMGVHLRSERRVLDHGGATSGFYSQNTLYPDQHAAIVVLTNTDSADVFSGITKGLEHWLFVTHAADSQQVAGDRRVFDQLRRGVLDRSLFTANGNASLPPEAVHNMARTLARLGPTQSFELTGTGTRGGFITRRYKAHVGRGRHGEDLSVVTRSQPDGLFEQFLVQKG